MHDAPAALKVQHEWWRNSHVKASRPLAFTASLGRFSGPELPHKVLCLGGDAITSFWESGLGRDLNARFQVARAITKEDLKDRLEYRVSVDTSDLRLFDARDAAARRMVGAQTSASFIADHATSRAWAAALMDPRARIDGIIYESTRQGPTPNLALFDTERSMAALPSGQIRAVRSSWENIELLGSLDREAVTVVGDVGIRAEKVLVPGQVSHHGVLLQLESLRHGHSAPDATKEQKSALVSHARDLVKEIAGPDVTGVPLRVYAQDYVQGRIGQVRVARALDDHLLAIGRSAGLGLSQVRNTPAKGRGR